MNAPAQLAQARAELDRMKAKEAEALKASEVAKGDTRKNARSRAMVGAGCLALGIGIGLAIADKRGLPLPNRFEPVSVINSNGRLHTATLWEDGKFHSVETGETIPQVTYWSRP